MEREQRKKAEKEALGQRKIDDEMREVCVCVCVCVCVWWRDGEGGVGSLIRTLKASVWRGTQ